MNAFRSFRLIRWAPVTALVVAVVAACGSDTPSSPSIAGKITRVRGDSQSVAAGTSLATPMVVKVVAQNGSPMLGQTVTWSLETGASGTLPSPTSLTDANGEASLSFNAGQVAGKAEVTATVGALAGVKFTQTVVAGPAAKLAKFAGDNAAGLVNAGVGLVVKVTDQYGNAVSGVTVSWELTSTGGTLSAATSTSDSAGLARVTLTLGATPGTYSAKATSGSLPTATFTVTAI
ncbi:MAG TPA: Ig-like domain-containing protein [Gemmatimonadaceae bacterium]|nr:Ig-like domain-containing protein [Gemmatimonadaceae bacterium]